MELPLSLQPEIFAPIEERPIHLGNDRGRPEFVSPEPVAAAPDGTPDLQESWRVARKIFEADETVELLVRGYNKGGLLVKWRGLQGFVPASQLANFPHFHLRAERYRELKRRQNQRITLKIIELEPKANRLVFSERATLVGADQREDVLRQLRPGLRWQGRVTNLTHFGAFVDLGGIEGLIHISELSWRK
ncbi:MAG: S1 RNA-binding domain-containing protein, partial [Chloroflexi bacterium]|nr:S1 RNA-binding domain-containing protein [Chloroflexota bacterium]